MKGGRNANINPNVTAVERTYISTLPDSGGGGQTNAFASPESKENSTSLDTIPLHAPVALHLFSALSDQS